MNQAKLQALIDRQVKGNIHNIVLGVQSQDGRINLAAAAGIADPESGAAMTPDTPYFIASITKMYTATVILKLVEQGRLDLDNPISKYLPADLIDGIHVYKGADYSGQIKVYQLVSHTSGLADYFEGKPRGGRSVFDDLKQGGDLELDVQQVMTIVRGLSPRFEPGARHGTKAHYSDTNYQLLGAIIESITGKSVADNFQDMIFAPLHLQHTYAYDAAVVRPDTPAAIYIKGRPAHVPKFMSSQAPDGGSVSTVSESLIFLRAFFDGRLFDRGFFDRMTGQWNRIFFPFRYGYGMMIFKLPRVMSPFKAVPEFIGHAGSTGSVAFYCPRKALYFAGTVNQVAAPGKLFRLMIQITNALE